MPVYEYLCRVCNRIYPFLFKSSSLQGEAPPCPRCGGPTERVPSSFSIGSAPPSSDGESGLPDMDALSGEDPRAMAAAIRRMADDLGEDLEPDLMDALSRLEAGEDPESVERDLEAGGMGSGAPVRDPGLYDPPGGSE